MPLHMIKLVVGVPTLKDFATLQDEYRTTYDGQPANIVHTRYKPRQEREVLDGGSLYRVIGGRIECRQEILGFEMAEDPAAGLMCHIYVAAPIIQTVAMAHRPFQGWRYLKPEKAPADRGPYSAGQDDHDMPAAMKAELQAAGLL